MIILLIVIILSTFSSAYFYKITPRINEVRKIQYETILNDTNSLDLNMIS